MAIWEQSLQNLFCHIRAVEKLQLHFDALFEAQNEFATANLHHQNEQFLVL